MHIAVSTHKYIMDIIPPSRGIPNELDFNNLMLLIEENNKTKMQNYHIFEFIENHFTMDVMIIMVTAIKSIT